MNKTSSMKKILFFLSLFVIGFAGCKSDKVETIKYKKPAKARRIPKFSGEKAYDHVAKQVSFGPRYTGSPGHKKMVGFLKSELGKYADEVITQDFDVSFLDVKNAKATNIIGVFNPKVDKRILLSAHFDTRKIAEKDSVESMRDQPILGADDGGSGVGVLLEIARLIKENGIDVGVDIIFFDAEDNGSNQSGWCLGSNYWGRNPHRKKYKAEFGILLDMVGARGAQFGKEANSVAIAKIYVDKIWRMAKALKKDDYFKNFNGGAIEDDHVYIYKGTRTPMVDIINTGKGDRVGHFGPHHHTHMDNMDIIDKNTLTAVGKTVTAVLYNFSNGTF